MQQAKIKNKKILEKIKLNFFGRMYMWFFKKMSSMFFPSILHDVVLHDVLFVWIDPSLICSKFHHHINDIFCKRIFYFCSGCKGPLHVSTIFKLYFPTLSSSQDSPICSNELAHYSKTLGRT
jgi:hypothetical protein